MSIVLGVVMWERDFCVNVDMIYVIIWEALNMFWKWRDIPGDVDIQSLVFGFEIEIKRNDSSQLEIRMNESGMTE